MNESAVPLVDVPAAPTPGPEISPVCFDDAEARLEIDLAETHPAPDDFDTLLEDIGDALGIQGTRAICLHISGAGTTQSQVRRVVRYVANDCDRAIDTLSVSPSARDALLHEAVGRPVTTVVPTPELRFTPPPVRALAVVDPSSELPAPAEAPLAADARTEHEASAASRPSLSPDAETDADDDAALPADNKNASSPADNAPQAALEAATDISVDKAVDTSPDGDLSENDFSEDSPTEAIVSGAAETVEALDGAEATDSPESIEAAESTDSAESTDAAESTDSAPTTAEALESAPTATVVAVEAEADVPHSRPWGASTDGDRRVLTLRRTIRSGKIVRFAGDVVIFGDVNAGAQIVADGDIVVLGRLRGLAHAGQRGDAEAIVVGLDMQSGQVRIGDTIAFPRPAAERTGTSRLAAMLRRAPPSPHRSVSPSVARVVDGEIRIEDYRGRLHA